LIVDGIRAESARTFQRVLSIGDPRPPGLKSKAFNLTTLAVELINKLLPFFM